MLALVPILALLQNPAPAAVETQPFAPERFLPAETVALMTHDNLPGVRRALRGSRLGAMLLELPQAQEMIASEPPAAVAHQLFFRDAATDADFLAAMEQRGDMEFGELAEAFPLARLLWDGFSGGISVAFAPPGPQPDWEELQAMFEAGIEPDFDFEDEGFLVVSAQHSAPADELIRRFGSLFEAGDQPFERISLHGIEWFVLRQTFLTGALGEGGDWEWAHASEEFDSDPWGDAHELETAPVEVEEVLPFEFEVEGDFDIDFGSYTEFGGAFGFGAGHILFAYSESDARAMREIESLSARLAGLGEGALAQNPRFQSSGIARPGSHRGVRGFVDLAALVALLPVEMIESQFDAAEQGLLDASGLTRLEWMSFHLGHDGEGRFGGGMQMPVPQNSWISRATDLLLPPPLALLAGLPNLPVTVSAGGIDLAGLVELGLEIASNFEPEAPAMFEEAMDEMSSALGIDLVTDLIGNLSGTYAGFQYGTWPEGQRPRWLTELPEGAGLGITPMAFALPAVDPKAALEALAVLGELSGGVVRIGPPEDLAGLQIHKVDVALGETGLTGTEPEFFVGRSANALLVSLRREDLAHFSAAADAGENRLLSAGPYPRLLAQTDLRGMLNVAAPGFTMQTLRQQFEQLREISGGELDEMMSAFGLDLDSITGALEQDSGLLMAPDKSLVSRMTVEGGVLRITWGQE